MLFTFLFLILSCGSGNVQKPSEANTISFNRNEDELPTNVSVVSGSDEVSQASANSNPKVEIEQETVNKHNQVPVIPAADPVNQASANSEPQVEIEQVTVKKYKKGTFNPINNKEELKISKADYETFKREFKLKFPNSVEKTLDNLKTETGKELILEFLAENKEKDKDNYLSSLLFLHIVSLGVFDLDLFDTLINQHNARINLYIVDEHNFFAEILTENLALLGLKNGNVDDLIDFMIYNGAQKMSLIVKSLKYLVFNNKWSKKENIKCAEILFSKIIELVDWSKDKFENKNLMEHVFNPDILYEKFVIETMKKSPKWKSWDREMMTEATVYNAEKEETISVPLMFNSICLLGRDYISIINEDDKFKTALFTFKTLVDSRAEKHHNKPYTPLRHFFKSNFSLASKMVNLDYQKLLKFIRNNLWAYRSNMMTPLSDREILAILAEYQIKEN